MRNTFLAVLILGLATTQVSAKSWNEVVDKVFQHMDKGGRQLLKDELKNSPPEMQFALSEHWARFKNEDWFNYGPEGKAAQLFTPSAGVKTDRGTLTGIYNHNGRAETHEYAISSKRVPDEFDILYDNFGYPGMRRDGHNDFYLSPKKNEDGNRLENDSVPSIFVARRYSDATQEASAREYYTALKVGDEARRFTLGSALQITPKGAKTRVIGADGVKQWNPDVVRMEALVTRESPTAPINKLEGWFKARGDTKDIRFEYELPPGPDGKARQIQDIIFTDNAAANEPLMEIVATDGERLVYHLTKDGDKVKPNRKTFPPTEARADMTQYRATIKPLASRTAVDGNSGEGAKGLMGSDTVH